MTRKVIAVIVTYGDRFHFIRKVIEAALCEGVDELVVVSNDSADSTMSGLLALKETNIGLHLLFLNENTGSANGFKVGIEEALKYGAEFIWLLDDDNAPAEDSLNQLKTHWSTLSDESKKTSVALLSYREDRQLYKKAIQEVNPRLMLGPNNSFLGFDWLSRLKKSKSAPNIAHVTGVVSVAPYGGLFFNKDLINKIGLPNEKYFLYGDDYEFTYRITLNGGSIYLVLDSKIVDLETSFHLIKTKRLLSNRFLKTDSELRIFYSVRNGILFEQNFVTNKVRYILNGCIYSVLTIAVLLLHFKHIWKIKYYLKGVFKSLKGL